MAHVVYLAEVVEALRPLSVHGSWKTLLRLHQPVHTMVSVPISLPADPAIPAAEVPAVRTPVGADA